MFEDVLIGVIFTTDEMNFEKALFEFRASLSVNIRKTKIGEKPELIINGKHKYNYNNKDLSQVQKRKTRVVALHKR